MVRSSRRKTNRLSSLGNTTSTGNTPIGNGLLASAVVVTSTTTPRSTNNSLSNSIGQTYGNVDVNYLQQTVSIVSNNGTGMTPNYSYNTTSSFDNRQGTNRRSTSNSGGTGFGNRSNTTTTSSSSGPVRKWIEIKVEIVPGLYNTRYVPISSLSQDEIDIALKRRLEKDTEHETKFSSGIVINDTSTCTTITTDLNRINKDYVYNCKKNDDNEMSTAITIDDNRTESIESMMQKEEHNLQSIINDDKTRVCPDDTISAIAAATATTNTTTAIVANDTGLEFRDDSVAIRNSIVKQEYTMKKEELVDGDVDNQSNGDVHHVMQVSTATASPIATNDATTTLETNGSFDTILNRTIVQQQYSMRKEASIDVDVNVGNDSTMSIDVNEDQENSHLEKQRQHNLDFDNYDNNGNRIHADLQYECIMKKEASVDVSVNVDNDSIISMDVNQGQENTHQEQQQQPQHDIYFDNTDNGNTSHTIVQHEYIIKKEASVDVDDDVDNDSIGAMEENQGQESSQQKQEQGQPKQNLDFDNCDNDSIIQTTVQQEYNIKTEASIDVDVNVDNDNGSAVLMDVNQGQENSQEEQKQQHQHNLDFDKSDYDHRNTTFKQAPVDVDVNVDNDSTISMDVNQGEENSHQEQQQWKQEDFDNSDSGNIRLTIDEQENIMKNEESVDTDINDGNKCTLPMELNQGKDNSHQQLQDEQVQHYLDSDNSDFDIRNENRTSTLQPNDTVAAAITTAIDNRISILPPIDTAAPSTTTAIDTINATATIPLITRDVPMVESSIISSSTTSPVKATVVVANEIGNNNVTKVVESININEDNKIVSLTNNDDADDEAIGATATLDVLAIVQQQEASQEQYDNQIVATAISTTKRNVDEEFTTVTTTTTTTMDIDFIVADDVESSSPPAKRPRM